MCSARAMPGAGRLRPSPGCERRRETPMWSYQKHLQYPIHIKNPDARAAQVIISQYGGPDGEIGASLRYLSQRYAMPNAQLAGILTDIGTEGWPIWRWWARWCASCAGSLTPEQIQQQGMAPILWTTPQVSGRRRRAAFPSRPRNLPARAMPSPICTRTWRPSRSSYHLRQHSAVGG